MFGNLGSLFSVSIVDDFLEKKRKMSYLCLATKEQFKYSWQEALESMNYCESIMCQSYPDSWYFSNDLKQFCLIQIVISSRIWILCEALR